VAIGAASTVGSAAGVVVSAPFAVIDPRTRDNFGDNLEAVGTNLGATVALAPTPLRALTL